MTSDVEVWDGEPTKPIRVKITLRNNRLIRAREEIGLSQAAAASAIGFGSVSTLLKYECLQLLPFDAHNELRATARLICDFYGYGPDYLWPEEVLRIERSSASAEVELRDVVALGSGAVRALTQGGSNRIEERETQAAIDEVLGKLKPRESHMVRQRLGLGGGMPMSLVSVGEAHGLSVERTRQIVARAEEKLRMTKTSTGDALVIELNRLNLSRKKRVGLA